MSELFIEICKDVRYEHIRRQTNRQTDRQTWGLHGFHRKVVAVATKNWNYGDGEWRRW